MKHIYYSIMACVLCLMGLAACSPDEFVGANEAGVPSISAYEDLIKIAVDQETNQVTFSIDGITGAQPVWIFEEKDRKSYSTRNGLERIFTVAGDYTVEVKVMNRNGLSDGSVLKTFHINNTLMNFDKYYKMLAGVDGSRQWRVQYNEQGHMGCGPSGTEGLEWWSAAPNDKKDWGVYDDRMTWNADNVYTYNPGEGGTMYVNTGCSIFAEFNTNDGADFMATVPVSTGTYSFDVVGEDLYIVLPAQTPFCYMPNDDFWNNPRLKVQSMNNTKMELIADNGGIAWHFILTSEPEAEVFKGFKYDSEYNLYKTASKSFSSIWFADANWGSQDEFNANGVKMNEDGFEFTMPISNTSEWQGQVHVLTDINLTAGTKYDFSCYVEAGAPIKRMTVKICPDGNDNDVLWYKNDIAIAEGTGVVYVVGAEAPIDMVNTRVIFDFGGNEQGNDIKVSNIVLKDNANDDGTVLPNEGGEETVKPLDYNGAGNLWKEGWNPDDYEYWYSAGDWSGGLAPEILVKENKELKLVIPTGIGGSEWQGQNKLTANISVSKDKAYDFGCLFTSTSDGVITVKLADANNDNDNAFFYEGSVAVKAFEEVVFTKLNVTPKDKEGNNIDYEKIMLIIDYGRLSEGTEISASGFVFQEHLASPDEINLSWDTNGNLWPDANVDLVYWYSGGDWSGQLHPEIDSSKANREYKVIIPEGIGGQEWMGQTHFKVDIPASAAKKYHFAVTLNSSEDCEATVKLAWEGHDTEHAMFYVGDFKLSAYNDCQFKQVFISPDTDYDQLALFIDLGRTPAGAEVLIKDFVFVEAE